MTDFERLTKSKENIEVYNDALRHYLKLDIPEERSKVLAKAASNGISLAKLDVIAKANFSVEQIELFDQQF